MKYYAKLKGGEEIILNEATFNQIKEFLNGVNNKPFLIDVKIEIAEGVIKHLYCF